MDIACVIVGGNFYILDSNFSGFDSCVGSKEQTLA